MNSLGDSQLKGIGNGPGAETSIMNLPELNMNTLVAYLCGSCGKENEKKPRDDVACHYCGGCILYKKRKREPHQCLAR